MPIGQRSCLGGIFESGPQLFGRPSCPRMLVDHSSELEPSRGFGGMDR
jgi:hypothetical protein